MTKKGRSKLGRCLGAPVRVLSRACDSACALYVRGMSGYASRVPVAVGAVAAGRGFGRPAMTTAASMHPRESSNRRDDLAHAASKQRQRQRRGAVEQPADVGAVKKKTLQAPAFVAVLPAKKKGAIMGTIAEDAPCHFGPTGSATRTTTRFGAIRTGSCGAFPRAPTVAPAC